ncbi:hypothetical protein GJAV_G00192980 [Gymnothorax javanicus]|nr:hypothetical protein GJAV_G00192980 [Gymnothorax javanicus]
MFSWIRLSRSGRTTQIQGSGADNSVLVLDSAEERHSGQYHCVAVKLNERVVSNVHNITVSAVRPQAVIATDPTASEVFAGETVSLACIIEGSGWRYSWRRTTQQRQESLSARSTDSQQKHIIDSVRESDGGTFFCQGERGQNPVIQSLPGSLVLNVTGGKPKPMITQNPHADTLYIGERVTLSCGFGGDSASWEYFWFKDSLKAALPNTDRSGVSYTIRSAALDHSGEYRCIATRGTKTFCSEYSDALTLHISEVFSRETVTLKCVIEDSPTDWMYKWYREGKELPVDQDDFSSETGDTYTILSADQSHTGQYRCRGELTMRPTVHSLDSSFVTLSVQAQLQAVLALSVGWVEIFTIIMQGSLRMRCELQGSSANWNYIWYRNRTKISLNHTGQSHTVGFWDSFSHEEYACQGNRTNGRYCSLISDGFTPANIRPYVILGLSGCVIIFITMVVLAVKCYKKRKIAGENQVDGETVLDFYPGCSFCEVVRHVSNPEAETRDLEILIRPGSEVATGQLSCYSAVLFKPLNQE